MVERSFGQKVEIVKEEQKKLRSGDQVLIKLMVHLMGCLYSGQVKDWQNLMLLVAMKLKLELKMMA